LFSKLSEAKGLAFKSAEPRRFGAEVRRGNVRWRSLGSFR